jgi:hypothetical protein
MFGGNSFWVTVNAPDHVARIDPQSKQVVDRISVDDAVMRIALSAPKRACTANLAPYS